MDMPICLKRFRGLQNHLGGFLCERDTVYLKFEELLRATIWQSQVEVIAGRNIPALMLPAGEFVMEVKDAADKMTRC